MSAPSAVTDMPAAKIQFGLATIRGRLTNARCPSGNSKLWSHLLVMPAPDEYTSPATVEVLAERRLGEKDQELTVRVRIGGYRRSYNSTDKESSPTPLVQAA